MKEYQCIVDFCFHFADLTKMEEEYQKMMQQLEAEYEAEKRKKETLEKDLSDVKEELENIEERFPQRVGELKDSIEQAKQQTADCERKTKELQKELDVFRKRK